MGKNTLAPLDALGMTPEFFHLPSAVAGLETLDYFLLTSDGPGTIQADSYWDLVAVGTPRMTRTVWCSGKSISRKRSWNGLHSTPGLTAWGASRSLRLK